MNEIQYFKEFMQKADSQKAGVPLTLCRLQTLLMLLRKHKITGGLRNLFFTEEQKEITTPVHFH